MGLFDGFLDKMKLNDNYDDDDERDLYDDDEEEEVSSVRRPRTKSEDIFEPEIEEERIVKTAAPKPPKQSRSNRPATVPTSNSKVVSMQKNARSLELCVIKPTNVEDGREISDTLLSGRPVVLNLEGIDVDMAQRIIDFTSGACYSIRGNLQKVTNYIFIITPENVDISGDFQDMMANGISLGKGLTLS